MSIIKCVKAHKVRNNEVGGGDVRLLRLHQSQTHRTSNTFQMTKTCKLILWHKVLNNGVMSWFFYPPFPSAEIPQVLFLMSASVLFPHLQKSVPKLSKPPERVKQTLTLNSHKSLRSSSSQRSNVTFDVFCFLIDELYISGLNIIISIWSHDQFFLWWSADG